MEWARPVNVAMFCAAFGFVAAMVSGVI